MKEKKVNWVSYEDMLEAKKKKVVKKDTKKKVKKSTKKATSK